MRRITCVICGNRRKPWWDNVRGYGIVRKTRKRYFDLELKVIPLRKNICWKCAVKELIL